jgi:hypothetical protein
MIADRVKLRYGGRMRYLLWCLVFSFACNKSATPIAPPAPSPMSDQAAAATEPTGANLKVTDELLTKFAVYQREMLPAMEKIMGVATGAAAKAHGDAQKFGEAAKDDSRTQDIAKITEAALVKSGLTQQQVSGITRLTSEYYAHAAAIEGAKKALAEGDANPAPAKNKNGKATKVGLSPIMRDVYTKQIAGFDQFKKDFAQKHGQDTLVVLDRHSEELVQITNAMLSAALAPHK